MDIAFGVPGDELEDLETGLFNGDDHPVSHCQLPHKHFRQFACGGTDHDPVKGSMLRSALTLVLAY